MRFHFVSDPCRYMQALFCCMGQLGRQEAVKCTVWLQNPIAEGMQDTAMGG